MKIKVGIFITLIFIICGYIAFQLYKQDKKDDEFAKECENSPRVNTEIFFITSSTQDNSDALLFYNGKPVKFDTITVVSGNEKQFNYSAAFDNKDKLEFRLNNEKYVLDNFKYQSVVINEKKGPECHFKGASFNGKWQEKNYFVIK